MSGVVRGSDGGSHGDEMLEADGRLVEWCGRRAKLVDAGTIKDESGRTKLLGTFDGGGASGRCNAA